MAVQLLDLTAAIRSVGRARIFTGSTAAENLMAELAATEGDVVFDAPETLNVLTAEPTGDLGHAATVTQGPPTATFDVITGDPALWAKVSATGSANGGSDAPQAPVFTTLAIIPENELGGGLRYNIEGTETVPSWKRAAGNGIAAATGAAAAPKNAIWIWRALPTNPGSVFRMADGGKALRGLTYTGFYDGARPNLNRGYTRGDPSAVVGMPTFRV